MTFTYEFKFQFKPAGDTISDQDWKVRSDSYIKCWETMVLRFARCSFKYKELDYVVEADWGPMLRSHRHHAKVMQELDVVKDLESFGDEHLKILNKFQKKRRSVLIQVTVNGAPSGEATNLHVLAESVATTYICDIFLISNLAAPGSCNFYLATLSKTAEARRPFRQDDRLSLSHVNFELTALNAQDPAWPPVRNLDVGNVTNWYFAHRPIPAQVAKARVERALFCLLHIAKDDGGPTQLVWIFHALEEVLATGPTEGQGRRVLRERIRALLKCNQQQTGELNKKFKKLYDARCEFVHGGLEIVHPLGCDVLDRGVDNAYWNIAENWEFGFRLLLAVVQETIANGWLQPEFDVSINVSGKPVQPMRSPSTH